MRGVKAFTGAAASVLLLACLGPMPALADTIEAALVRAYQNNPQLNAQRAQVRATDENVPQALSGYRPKVAVTASAGYQYTDTLTTSGGTSTRIVRNRTSRHQCAAQRRRHRHADALQRPADRQQDPRGGEPGLGRARRVAGARADRAASARHHLHGLSARFRDRRGSEEQRARARADAEADPRPLQCRRSDAHRRRAVGGAARRRQDAAADRRSQSDHDALEFPPHHRQRAGNILRRARRSIASCRPRCRPPSISA